MAVAAGDPPNFGTTGILEAAFTTDASFEPAVRNEQQPSDFGRDEQRISRNDERGCRSVIPALGPTFQKTPFNQAHTIDIGIWFEPEDAPQDLIVEHSRNQSVEPARENCCFTDHKINGMIEITVFVIQDERLRRVTTLRR